MVTAQGNKKRTKAPVRRNIDVRREQNRIASRNYREKRKQRLELLDHLLEPIEGSLESHEPSGVVDDGAPSVIQSNSSAEPVISWPALTLNNWDSFPIDQSSTGPFSSLPYVHDADTANSIDEPDQAYFPVTTDEPLNVSLVRKEPASSSRSSDSVLAILGTINHLSDEQKKELMQHLQSQVEDSPVETSRRILSQSQASQPGNWVSRTNRRSATETRLQREARRFAAFINRNASGGVNPAQLSRVYAHEAALFGAIFANCYALGMDDVEPLMGEDGASVFCLGPDTGYEASQLPMVRAMFSSVTQDLQPCDVQLTFGHHPYLDVLPWKSFRRRTLELLQRDATVIDEEELCRDICHGGLICWGGQQNSTGMEAGVPWDVRSWEPALWFLEKYRFLVGGWDDEMWKGARYWHHARGEKLRLPTPYILQDLI